MQALIQEFIKIYEQKRAEFMGEIQQDRFTWREYIFWAPAPKLEKIIDKEEEFYNEVVADILSFAKLKKSTVNNVEWKKLALLLKNHNERLACHVDNNTNFATLIALVSAVCMFAVSVSTNKIYIAAGVGAFITSIWAGGQIFFVAVKDRHALSSVPSG